MKKSKKVFLSTLGAIFLAVLVMGLVSRGFYSSRSYQTLFSSSFGQTTIVKG